jgi:hypothetical protein
MPDQYSNRPSGQVTATASDDGTRALTGRGLTRCRTQESPTPRALLRRGARFMLRFVPHYAQIWLAVDAIVTSIPPSRTVARVT